MILLNVLLLRNRDVSGWLRVEKEGRPIAEFSVLGRGSRGPGDTSMLLGGNTPTGDYRGRFTDTDVWPQASYGVWGAVRLEPVSGDAIVARDIFGRRGILIHGGSVGGSSYWRGAGSLRATYGCLRISNSDMARLREIIEDARFDEDLGVCREVKIEVTVRELE